MSRAIPGKIIGGSFDDSIHIWEIESGHCLQTLNEHQDLISRLMVQNGKLLSTDREGLVIAHDRKIHGDCQVLLRSGIYIGDNE